MQFLKTANLKRRKTKKKIKKKQKTKYKTIKIKLNIRNYGML